MELHEYLTALRKRWRIVIVSVFVLVWAAIGYSLLAPRQYEADTQIFVAVRSGNTSDELSSANDYVERRVQSYTRLVDSEAVLGPVITELGLTESVGELAERVEATAPLETVMLTISATDSTGAGAAELTNAVTEQFRVVVTELEPTEELADESLIELTVVDPAVAPWLPVSPNAKLVVLLGLLSGIAVGFALAVARETMDKRVRNETDVRQITSTPIIGRIPVDRAVARQPLLAGVGAGAEAVRQVRTNLQFISGAKDHRSFVVTSSLQKEGKTTLCINLAIAHAEAGMSVCLVDADLRQPQVADHLGLDDAQGLSDLLIDKATPGDVVQSWSGGGARPVQVIAAGSIPPNPSELLASEAMRSFLTMLEQRFDIVLIDSPPLLPYTDATILGQRCSGAIVVVAFGQSAVTTTQLGRSLEGLAAVDAPVRGVVLNKLTEESLAAAAPSNGRGHRPSILVRSSEPAGRPR